MRRIALSLVALVALALPARAQEAWPVRPVRLIVPFPPGGTSDLLARLIGQRLGTLWGQGVVIDNRPGASGHVGAEAAARAPADGYTLVAGTIGIHAAYAMYRKLAYDPATDLATLTVTAENANVLVVPPALPVRSLADLMALARARPEALNYGSAGSGSSVHMVTELFRQATGLTLTHVPYKGSGPALTALIGGEIQLMFENLPTAQPHIAGGTLRALAVTSAARDPSRPELPTVAEAGVPGFAATSWFTIAAPAGLPATLAGRLNGDLRRVLTDPAGLAELAKLGINPVASDPAATARFIADERTRWTALIRDTGMQVD